MPSYSASKKNLFFTPGKVVDALAKIISGTDKNGAVFAVGAAKPITVNATAGATPALAYGFNSLTLTANAAPVFPTAVAGQDIVVAYKQDGTGSRLLTHPASVKTPGGTAIVLSTAAGKTDVIHYRCIDGTNWFAAAPSLDVR